MTSVSYILSYDILGNKIDIRRSPVRTWTRASFFICHIRVWRHIRLLHIFLAWSYRDAGRGPIYKASAGVFACVTPLFHYQQHRGGSTGRSTFDTDIYIYIALKYIPTKASLNLIYLATLLRFHGSPGMKCLLHQAWISWSALNLLYRG